jgi:hypothetical protein
MTMLDVLMLFPRTADAAQLDAFLAAYVPALKAAPGLRSLRLSQGELMAKGARPAYSAVLEASFDSLADWMAQVPTADRTAERDAFDRLDPLVLFFEVREP